MKEIFSILLGFLPWIVLALFPGRPVAVERSHHRRPGPGAGHGLQTTGQRVILTWGSLLFFGVNLVMVVLCRNLWVIKNLDILSHGTWRPLPGCPSSWANFCPAICPGDCAPGAAGSPGLLPDLPDSRGDLGVVFS